MVSSWAVTLQLVVNTTTHWPMRYCWLEYNPHFPLLSYDLQLDSQVRLKLLLGVQSGVHKTQATEIELSQIDGAILTALVSYMYGKLQKVEDALLLPLFQAADTYQASCSTAFCRTTCSLPFSVLVFCQIFSKAPPNPPTFCKNSWPHISLGCCTVYVSTNSMP